MDKTSIKIFLSLICLCLISSCSDTQNRKLLKLDECEVVEYNESAQLQPTKKGQFPIPDEYAYAKVTDRESKSKDEENLIRQYKTYVSGLLMSDLEACKKYTFKDAVAYHKKMFPSYSEREIWEQYFSSTSAAKQLSELAANQNWDIVACVPVFFDKVTSQDEIFVTFGSTLYIDAHNFALTPRKLEKCIAHSSNNGKNWEFITLNSDSKGILSLSCSEDVIDILTKTSDVSVK